eukprot:gene17919-25066_t
MQGHACCIGQFYPFDGIDVNCQIPVADLLRRELGQQRKIPHHHQALNVMRVTMAQGLTETVAQAGHVGLAVPEPVRQFTCVAVMVRLFQARHVFPVNAADEFAPSQNLPDKSFRTFKRHIAVAVRFFSLCDHFTRVQQMQVVIGSTVKMAFVDQHRDALSDDKTVWEDISGGLDMINIGKFTMASRAYAGRFNFNGGDQQKKVGMLSGGERGRLHLAKTLIAGGNVLLLDEPSNDLDVETLRALEDALLEFAGCALVISHDRWFLDRIATHILAAEGDSKWVFFDGNYQEYEADKKKRLGEEGARPKRVRFKALK